MNEISNKKSQLRSKLNEAIVNLESYRFPFAMWITLCCIFSFVAASPIMFEGMRQNIVGSDIEVVDYLINSTIGSFVFASLLLSSRYRSKKERLERKRNNLAIQVLELESNELQDELEEDFFTNLVKINFKYIDKYYLQTQLQADKSFWLSASAALTGLALVTLGVLLMLFKNREPGYVTATAGVVGEFISAIFFYLYTRTINKMSDYHQKLVLTQNVSLALKISDDLPDAQKAETKSKLVEYLSKDINWLLSGSNNSLPADARTSRG